MRLNTNATSWGDPKFCIVYLCLFTLSRKLCRKRPASHGPYVYPSLLPTHTDFPTNAPRHLASLDVSILQFRPLELEAEFLCRSLPTPHSLLPPVSSKRLLNRILWGKLLGTSPSLLTEGRPSPSPPPHTQTLRKEYRAAHPTRTLGGTHPKGGNRALPSWVGPRLLLDDQVGMQHTTVYCLSTTGHMEATQQTPQGLL